MSKKVVVGALAVLTAVVLFLSLRPAEVEVGEAPPPPDAATPSRAVAPRPVAPQPVAPPPAPPAEPEDAAVYAQLDATVYVADAGPVDAARVVDLAPVVDAAPLPLDAAPLPPPPVVDAAPPDFEGASSATLDAVAVQEAVGLARPRIGECYRQALARDATLKGVLVVKFTVERRGGDGRIRDAEIQNDGLVQPFLEMCVLDALGQVRYPVPEGYGEVTVTYPFVLRP